MPSHATLLRLQDGVTEEACTLPRNSCCGSCAARCSSLVLRLILHLFQLCWKWTQGLNVPGRLPREPFLLNSFPSHSQPCLCFRNILSTLHCLLLPEHNETLHLRWSCLFPGCCSFSKDQASSLLLHLASDVALVCFARCLTAARVDFLLAARVEVGKSLVPGFCHILSRLDFEFALLSEADNGRFEFASHTKPYVAEVPKGPWRVGHPL